MIALLHPDLREVFASCGLWVLISCCALRNLVISESMYPLAPMRAAADVMTVVGSIGLGAILTFHYLRSSWNNVAYLMGADQRCREFQFQFSNRPRPAAKPTTRGEK